MWKEKYQLGIERIDAQHKKLFEKAGELVQEIEGAQRPEAYKEIVKFLQDYVAYHFRDEESYFESLGYADEEEHKKQHRELTQVVEKYAIQLEASQYDYHSIKKLAGMLSAWLIYHVVHEDLKYTGHANTELNQKGYSYLECFTASTVQVLEAMVGLSAENIQRARIYEDLCEGDVFIEIELVGELTGRVVFGFYKEFACNLVEAMMSFSPPEIDELVCSALAEVSNIASGNGTISISQEGTACDICPPKILESSPGLLPLHEKMGIETAIGKMTVAIYLD